MHSAALFLQMAPMKMAPKRSSNVRQVVKSILDSKAEHKQAVFDFSASSLAAGVVTDLTEAIIQGDGVDQRSGNQIVVQQIDFHMTSIAAVEKTSCLRCILFVDRINIGSRPVVTDVLSVANPSSSFAQSGRVQNRFKILADFYLKTSSATAAFVAGSGSGITSGLPKVDTCYHKIRLNDKVFYNAATAVAGANGKGAIHMIFIDISDSATTYRLGMNIAYTDI